MAEKWQKGDSLLAMTQKFNEHADEINVLKTRQSDGFKSRVLTSSMRLNSTEMCVDSLEDIQSINIEAFDGYEVSTHYNIADRNIQLPDTKTFTFCIMPITLDCAIQQAWAMVSVTPTTEDSLVRTYLSVDNGTSYSEISEEIVDLPAPGKECILKIVVLGGAIIGGYAFGGR